MKRVAILIISIICSITARAGNADTLNISCINEEANYILFNEAQWDGLFDQLASLQDPANTEQCIISIVHLGDSHVQAGFLSAALRTPLQERWGNAGRGLITPLKLTESNEPTDYRITSPDTWDYFRCVGNDHYSNNVGLSGIAIVPTTPHIDLYFEALSSTGDDVSFNTIRLFHTDSEDFPQLYADTNDMLVTVDFSPCGETRFTWDNAYARSSMRLQGFNSYAQDQAFIYGASLENGHNGILFHTIGNNSATYECYNKVNNYATKLACLAPHIIIISMGTNESVFNTFSSSTFYRQIDRLVTSIRTEMPEALILLTTPGDNMIPNSQKRGSYKTNPHIEEAAETIRQYGADKHIAVWDWFTISGGANSCTTWVNEEGMAKDHIHYTLGGYAIQGNLLYQSICKAYEQYIR